MSNTEAFNSIMKDLAETDDPKVQVMLDVAQLEQTILSLDALFREHPAAVTAYHEALAKLLVSFHNLESKIYVGKCKS